MLNGVVGGVVEKIAGAFGKGLGKYKFLRLLNTGSMSRVWTAIDSYSRTYAVKVTFKDVEKLTERLRVLYRGGKSEGQVTCEFIHPNIVRGVEYGRSYRGEYLVMELMNGKLFKETMRSAREQLRQGDMSPLIRCAHALHYIHESGYVHRDFNPRNIMMFENGQLKIFDFGLTVLETRAQERPGNRTGTAAYMAPEIIRRLRNDRRSDIYSFGVMMFEIVAGRRPVEAEAGFDKVMQTLNAKLPHPSEFYPQIDPDFEAIINRAMAPDPSRRFLTAQDLALALKRIDKSRVDFDAEYDEFDRAQAQAKAARVMAQAQAG